MAWRLNSYLWFSLPTLMEKWAMEARLWGLVVRGSGINQPELRLPWNQKSSEHRMPANVHGPTNLQVYSKPAKLNCFCRQSCVLRLDNAAGGDRSLLENWHGISPSLHHSLEQRLACRVLPEKRYGSLTWTASLPHMTVPCMNCVLNQGVLFALSMISNSSGCSVQTQLHISTTQGALKTTRPIRSGLPRVA